MFKVIHEHILNMNQTNHVHPLLIIDEADKLGNDILQEIRLIANFNYDSYDAVTFSPACRKACSRSLDFQYSNRWQTRLP